MICQTHLAEDIHYAVWQIEESLERLKLLYQRYDSDITFLQRYSLESKQRESLAARLSLCCLLKGISPKINYLESGKPFLSSAAYQISLTHTRNMAAAVLSRQYSVGIDIERCSARILDLSSKFMSDSEMKNLKNPQPEQLHLYWGAKEAMYKMRNNPELIFKKDLQVFSNLTQGQIQDLNAKIPVQIFSKMIAENSLVITYSTNYKMNIYNKKM